MVSRSWLAPVIAAPIVGALGFSATTPASAMTSYAAPAMLSASVTSAQPVAYYYRRHHYYGYGGGAAFAAAAFGMIAAIAASSAYDDCDWGACGDYGYYGGGPYYGGWGGYGHWRHWQGHPRWEGGGPGWGHHAFAHAGGGGWLLRRRHGG